MARLNPPESAWQDYRRPLEDGEKALARFLAGALDDTWDVFTHVWLNGAEVDVAAWSPVYGLLLYEVKDWGASRRLRTSNGVLHAESHVERNPLAQVEAHRLTALGPISPLRRASSGRHVVAGVYLHHWATQDARDLLTRLRPAVDGTKGSQTHPIVGRDALTLSRLPEVLGCVSRPSSPRFGDEVHAGMMRLLTESEADAEQREPLPLSGSQLRVVRSRTPTGYRQIVGPAGSGKTSILAARAAELSALGRRPIVVTFNHTLWHWVRDLAVRHRVLEGRAKINQIRFCTFHSWAEDVCEQAGLRTKFRSVIAGGGSYPTAQIQDLVEEALRSGVARSEGGGIPLGYDDLLVDEGQDLDQRSWDLLRRSVIEGDQPGERLIALDAEQNMYGTDLDWVEDEGRRSFSGFRGRPLQLGFAYRLPPALVPALNDFRRQFLDEHSVDIHARPNEEVPTQLTLGCRLEWIQASVHEFESELARVAAEAPARMGLNPADVVVLVQRNEVGLRLVRWLQQGGHRVKHVFGDSQEQRKSSRQSFWKGQTMLASTIHSFKGWEQRGVVMSIESPPDEEQRNSLVDIYVAMTRVKASQVGTAALTVVCADERLRQFGETWFQSEADW